ncbi:MAG: B12-binding domain-containing radical SAM protein [Candidatus Bathyarchaeales archaeon]
MTEKIKVALVNPPIIKGAFQHHPYLPIGLTYLAAVLEKNSYEFKVIDCAALGMDHKKLEGELASFQPDVVGITSMTPTAHSALLSAQIAKNACPESLVILGGPHAHFMDKKILFQEKAVDFIVRGEGEQTLLELLQCISSHCDPQKIMGITFRKDENIVRTPDRPFIEELDELPFPAYHYFPLKRYRLFGKMIFPIITSRGCPFQCSFCVTSRMFGKKFRSRKPENVAKELEWLINNYGAGAVSFYDDTLTLDKNRIIKLFEEIKRRRIDIPWDCQTRVDQVSEEILKGMKEANCQQVLFGVESGSQKILSLMKKGTTVEQNEKAIKLAKEAGLFVAISVIIGYPGETSETLEQTFNFIKKVKPDDVYVCIATPYPGTELRSLIENMGWKISNDWSLYDTVTPVFENPLLPTEEITRIRAKFYDDFYSPSYIITHMFKKNLYSRIMARTAANHFIWRLRSIGMRLT